MQQFFLTLSLIFVLSTPLLSLETMLMARVVEKHNCLESLGPVISQPKECVSWTRRETAAPLVDVASSRIFIGGSDGYLHVLDAKHGHTLKRLALEGNLMSAPILAEKHLVFGTDRGKVYKIKADDLSIVWTKELDSGVLETPHASGDKIVFVTQLGTLYSVNLLSGDVAWSKKRELPTRIVLRHFSMPISNQTNINGTPRDVLTIGSPAGKLEFIDVNTGDTLDEIQLGSTKEPFGDVATTPVLADGLLYAASYNNGLVAIDGASRVRKWELKDEKGITELAFGKDILVAAGAKVVLGINAKSGKVLWRFAFSKGAPTSITIRGGEIYVGSDIDGLYVLDLRTGKPLQVLGSGLGFASGVKENSEGMLAMSSAGALFFFNRTDRD
jgi:outer membrane protein assembly factor BamB